MPLQLRVPLEQEFELKESDRRFGSEGESTRITIRQATQAAHERRAALFANVIRELGKDSGEDVVRLIQRFSFEELKRIEVFLTLVGCNILGPDDKPLFRFNSNGKMSEADFNEAWGKLPPFVCDEMHDCVLEVNVDWRPMGE